MEYIVGGKCQDHRLCRASWEDTGKPTPSEPDYLDSLDLRFEGQGETSLAKKLRKGEFQGRKAVPEKAHKPKVWWQEHNIGLFLNIKTIMLLCFHNQQCKN